MRIRRKAKLSKRVFMGSEGDWTGVKKDGKRKWCSVVGDPKLGCKSPRASTPRA